MKFSLTIIILCFFFNIIFAQDVKIKKRIVFIDGVECLKISGDPNNVSFSDMEGNDLFFLKYLHNTKYATLYNKITFVNQKVSFTSKDYIYTKKLLINRFLKNGILNECNFDAEKIENFIMKFDENVEYDIPTKEVIIIKEEKKNPSLINIELNIDK